MEIESLLRMLFLSWLFDHFELDKMEEDTDQISVYLSEKKIVPSDIKGNVQAYGYTGYSSVQDFPIKGKAVYLHLRRCKWREVNTEEIITRKFEIAHDDGDKLRYQYKEHISDFRQWEKDNPYPYVLYKKNMGPYLSIGETCLSQGELYTIVTYKEGRGKKGTFVAMVHGTKSEDVIFALSKRLKVKESTLDLSPTMRLIAKKSFPNAILVSDRFHVQPLMNEAVSDLRIDYRWQAIDLENGESALAKEAGRKHMPHVFEKGDTRRQLLARSRHSVMKHFSKWTLTQSKRAEILFREYPAIEEAYKISMKLTQIYNTTTNKNVGLTRLARWYDKVEKLNLKFFKSVIETMQNNYGTIVNYFDNRSTNASAESFNAKG